MNSTSYTNTQLRSTLTQRFNSSNPYNPLFMDSTANLLGRFLPCICSICFICRVINIIFLLAVFPTNSLHTDAGVLIWHMHMTLVECITCLIHMAPIYLTHVFLHSQLLLAWRITQFLFSMTNTAGVRTIPFLAGVNRFVGQYYTRKSWANYK